MYGRCVEDIPPILTEFSTLYPQPMKVQAPCLSLEAHGGLGLYTPLKKRPPLFYPIALYPCFFYPYARVLKPWYDPDPSIYIKFDPYAPYNFYGWYYQLRRTWHGIIWAAIRNVPITNPQEPGQQTWRQVFADGVSIWQGMSNETQDIYNKLKYPRRMLGYNRFLHYYLKEHYPPAPPAIYYLLLETGDKILQEDGYGILLE